MNRKRLIGTGMILAAAVLLSCTEQKTKLTAEPSNEVLGVTGDTDKKFYDELIAINAPGGLQLPPPVKDYTNWQSVNAGLASMLIPPGWKIHDQEGTGPEDRIRSVGVVSAAEDIYVELRIIQDSDSNYMQTVMNHAQSDYSMSKQRLAEGVVLGFQPMVLDGTVGKVEIMNQFGREKNEDGSPTFRMIIWGGRWEKDGSIDKVEFQATFAQNRYKEFAPVVSNILSTIKTSKGKRAGISNQ
jgi:hypothetical protein